MFWKCYFYLLDIIIDIYVGLFRREAMAKLNHELTNRRVLATKEYTTNDWRTITCIYPRKCDICKNWIDNNTKVLWNIKTKHIMHQDCI